MTRALLVSLLLAACGDDTTPATPDAAPTVDAAPLTPTANPNREVLSTSLMVDVTAHTATATIAFPASDAPGATLEVGDLMIDSVALDGAALPFAVKSGKLDLALPLEASTVDVTYHYQLHDDFTGVSSKGFTLVWPYYCGNMFPCHSDPDDGTTFSLALTGVDAAKTAIYPTTIPAEAPSYQIAWAVDAYHELVVGTTTAGTQISIFHRANEATNAMSGSIDLLASFDWFEKTLGPYRFGPKAGGVSVSWGAGALGGMEHHPYWHVGSGALKNREVNIHEAAHGWYGDGIRIACWEDFVLSEGTVTYLAGRALDVVDPPAGQGLWSSTYTNEYNSVPATDPVWPEGCHRIDILKDNLFTNAPYMRGAFFYRGVALKVGADKLDLALAKFYADNAGKAAHMTDMLATIQSVTGYDATACATMFLRSTTKPAAGTACP